MHMLIELVLLVIGFVMLIKGADIFVEGAAGIAAKFGILPKQAYNYMKRFQGLDYIYRHYGVLHTYSFEDSVAAIMEVCRHNGGKLG